MTKTISKVGNSQGIIFDAALMDLARVKVGDKVNVTVHPGGSIVLTPIHPKIDSTLLESAVAAPQATIMGQPLISDPIEIAAAYLFYLCRNHPFVDGNKRTALAACLVFLEANDLLPSVKLAMEHWENFVLDLATSKLDRDATTARLRKLLKRRRRSNTKKKSRRERESRG